MLQGTFETLSLPEVLGLLASARKSGALWLDAGPITGVAHLEDGHCRAAECGDQRGPLESGASLLPRLVDMCFAIMCQESGSFRFAADDRAPWTCPEPIELSDVLVEVDRLLKQWREILRVIPSLECRPQLLDALAVDELVIDRDRWALLVAIDGRRTVRELVQRTNRPVIELCQSLLELIDAGAIGVIDPAAALPPEAPEAAAPEIAATETTFREETAVPEVARPDLEWPDERTGAEASPPEAASPDVGTASGPSDPAARTVVDPPDPAPVVLTIVPEAVPEPLDERRDGLPDSPLPQQLQSEPPPGADAPDKGAFLRLFSGLRDS